MGSRALPDDLRDTLAIFDAEEPRTTDEVATRLDLCPTRTRDRLVALVEADRIRTKIVGNHERVWWRARSSGDRRVRFRDTRGGEFASFVDAVEEYAIFMLDTDGHVQTWNPGAERIKGYERDQVVDEHFSIFYIEADREAGVPDDNLSAARADGSTEDRGWRVRADDSRFWAHVTITAIRDSLGELVGYAKVTRDMTDWREHEEALRQQRDFIHGILDAAPVGVLAIEEDGTFITANKRANALLELDTEEAGSNTVGDKMVYDENGEFVPPDERPYLRALETGEPVRGWHAQLELSDGTRRWLSTNVEPMTDENGRVEQVLVCIQDISRLKAQADRIARQRDELRMELDEIFTRIDDAFLALDDEWNITYVNDRAAEMVRLDPGKFIGSRVWDVLIDADGEEPRERVEHAMDAVEPFEFEFFSEVLDDWLEIRGYPSETGMSVYFRDVTDRKARERSLERFETIVRTIDDGVFVLDCDCHFMEVNEAFLEMTGFDRSELLGAHYSVVVADADCPEFDERMETVVAGGTEGGTTLETDIARRDGSRLHGESNFSLLTQGNDEVVETVGVVRDVTERVAREKQLDRQREQLATLNSLHEVVREITEAVINQSTRIEIEQTVCDALAGADEYEFSWLAEVDQHSNLLKPRASANTGGYTEEVVVSLDPDELTSQGPAATAIREQETQVVRDVFSDPTFAQWREVAAEFGYSSVASIPILHEGIVYGVLGVYADREKAFDGREVAVISQLGEIIGHAIAATERKQALMSDELVELEFRIPELFLEYGDTVDIEGRVTFEHTLPIGEDTFIVYGRASPAGLETLSELVDLIPRWRGVTVRAPGDPASFELTISESSILTAIAGVGGLVDTAVLEDGDLSAVVHLAPSVDVRHIVGEIETMFPQTEILRRQQITRARDDLAGLQRHLERDLTERQRVTLKAAYHAGFFEWPRKTDGEEVAASLDISPATFSQHLRAAERKVFDALLSTPT